MKKLFFLVFLLSFFSTPKAKAIQCDLTTEVKCACWCKNDPHGANAFDFCLPRYNAENPSEEDFTCQEAADDFACNVGPGNDSTCLVEYLPYLPI